MLPAFGLEFGLLGLAEPVGLLGRAGFECGLLGLTLPLGPLDLGFGLDGSLVPQVVFGPWLPEEGAGVPQVLT